MQILNFKFGSKLPLIRQSEVSECGLACLAMIAGFYNYRTDLTNLRSKNFLSLKGINLKGLSSIASELGLMTRALQLEIENIRNVKTPAVLHWNLNHFVVLKSATDKKITIHDPASGVKSYTYEQFSRHFTGIALEVWPGLEFKEETKVSKLKIRSLLQFGQNKILLLKILMLSVALEVFSLLNPLFMQQIIDDVVVTGDKNFLILLAAGFSLVLVLNQAISLLRSWGIMVLLSTMSLRLKSSVFHHLTRLPISYFERRHAGDLYSRFGSSDSILNTLTNTLITAILDGVMSLATLALMYYCNAVLATIVVVAVFIYFFFRVTIYSFLRSASEKQIHSSAKIQTYFLETLRGMKTIKLFQRQTFRERSWQDLAVSQLNSSIDIQKLQMIQQRINALIFGLENIALVYVGANYVIDAQMTVGVLVAFVAYKTQFESRVSSFIDKVFDVAMIQIQVDRLSDIVLTPQDSKEINYLVGLEDVNSDDLWRIQIKNLNYKYSEYEQLTLSDISLSIAEGEYVCFMGESGCGKTTLLNLLLGVISPFSGAINYINANGEGASPLEVRKDIGTVLQDDVLFAGSIMDNITFFDTKPDVGLAERCAKLACIHEEILTMPMKYSSLVGDMGSTLSGGQKQRVLIARALYKKPKILLLDEATSHLDVKKEIKISNAIRHLKLTRIAIAHRSETAVTADRIITFSKGKIILDETRAQFIARRRVEVTSGA
ncbi:peptidase domain-containing ABC transporter [Pseudomonas kuykendallii]|jgi:ATP-binding cassette subfamily B protein RaxB|uniref:ABC transporter n=1 Tax=Pseudomonas kuykendallii TaxID=1007099 RepID=A0A2W5CNJ8_9PSED|nr:peptidase domain-containing ABC transporter [Pseudomonas kuykendallii]PZP20741.1 MAG: ABC transporter [Pseudomonas kuykendallii]